MRVERIQLRDFRNYEAAEVEPAPGLTVVAGANGAGKTNLLEAIYFGCTARSCRTSNERELVRFGAKVARVELEVVRRVGLLAQKNAPLRLRFSEGALDVSAQTPDVGEASESLPVPFNGEPLEIGFNPEFLRDGLESTESEDLVLKLISPLRPGLIESGDDGGFVYLVMPIRLNV